MSLPMATWIDETIWPYSVVWETNPAQEPMLLVLLEINLY